MNPGNPNQSSNTTRPAVLDNISSSQMEELEEHYNGGDAAAWDRLVDSYGWSQQDGQAVWQWFSEQPEQGSSAAL